ncbi:VOC family protein [Stutzerimonas urumqiensis]|uniref:VOC family protein n=1 Tax=Stutzerimonas urumqiensis TaxID=638269 RepID=UPI003DA5B12F
MSKRPGRLNGLRHLAMLVPNLEECERFYVDVLGMEVLHRANEDLVYLTCGNDNLSLGRAHVPASGEQTVDHYGFIVDSVEELDAWYAYFKALGITLLDRPFDHGDGARSFHLLDPAGNKIQPLFHPAVSGQRFSRATSRPE